MAVVEYGGVSAAASRLGTNLSTLSRDLSNLEKRLGIELCRRGRSGFALTPQGEDVHRAATRLFSELQSFEQTIQNTRRTLGGGFNLGVIDNVIANPEAGIVDALEQMHHSFPDMLINVSVHIDPMIDVQVRDRRIDVGLTGQPEWLQAICYEPAFAEEQRLYISRTSPHGERTHAAFAADTPGRHGPIPYIARDYRTEAFQAFERRYPLQITGHGSTLDSILAGVLAGVGCALLPVHFVRAVGSDSLVEVPTAHTPLQVRFHFAYRRDAPNLRAIRALLACFRR